MAKPRAKTWIEKQGFLDKDLVTPRHDNLIATICDMDMLLPLLSSMFYPRLENEEPPIFSYWSIDKSLECPVKNGSYVIGFVDVLVRLQRELICDGCKQFLESKARHEHLYLVDKERNKMIPCDTHSGRAINYWSYRQFAIEAKVKVDSVGELIRQINTYREYLPDARNTTWIVVSVDDCAYKELLAEQKIFVFDILHK